jgi:hypothetical protein
MPLVFLRRAGWSWRRVVIVALLMRLAYHVYYGWPAAGLMVWALLMFFIYLRTRAIIGIIVAHSYWDVTITIGHDRSEIVGGLMIMAALFSIGAWVLVRGVLRFAGRFAKHPAGATNPAGVGWYQNDTGHWWWWDGESWTPQSPG